MLDQARHPFAPRRVISELVHVLDVNTLTPWTGPTELGLNDLGRVRLLSGTPLVADPYDVNRSPARS